MVLLHTGTNFPAVSVNSLLAVAMMKTRQRWNETGVPIQSQPHAASLTISACVFRNNVAFTVIENRNINTIDIFMDTRFLEARTKHTQLACHRNNKI
jgi:hypothetical protein